MNDPEPNDLIWRGLKGELNDQEKTAFEKLLSSDGRAKSQWEEELALNELLAKLPEAPVSSNFTSLVMQAAQREDREAARTHLPFPWLRLGFARVTAGLAVVLMIGLGLQNRYQKAQQKELAAGLQDLTRIASVINTKSPAMETLQNFDAIQKLSRVPASSELDMELLLALQK